VGHDYYLVTSSFTYFPGVPIFHSRDLVSWKQLGHCLNRPSQLRLDGAPSWGGVWAPTIRFHQGTFYVTTTNVSSEDHFTESRGSFIVTASAPEGPWSDPINVAQPGIDPSLFFDEDGSVYFTTSHGGALQSRIDVKTGHLLSEPKVVWSGTGGKHPEGPHLYRHQGHYYLLISEGGTEYGHMVTVARSTSPWGPFEPCARNPVLSHRSQMSAIQGAGHADLVDTPDGAWFAVALAFRPHGYPPCHHLGRETYLCPVTWHEDGFPVFGDAGRLELEHATHLPLEPSLESASRDDFTDETLAPHWNHLRDPNPSTYSLSERPGYLRLKGSAAGLDDVAAPAWLGRRQAHFDVKVTTCLEFAPSSPNDEAGLVVRMNERHHYEVFVTEREGAKAVVLRRRIGGLVAEEATRAVPPNTARVILQITANAEKYVFSCGDADALTPIGEGEARYLSTEVAGGFTGVYFAMYATGNGSPCAHPADFAWFDYASAS
jgi:alpha-N-arabinofuranosidase